MHSISAASRVVFGLFVIALFFAADKAAIAQEQSLTARQVIERIQEHTGLIWSEQTVDTFKAGDADAPVTGIAVTMMATLDVLQRAAAAGHNLIISHEPIFYNHYDETAALEQQNDPVYATKKAFIEEHGLIVWRFHDYWHQRQPDGVRVGMVKALGWQDVPQPIPNTTFVIPETSVEALAKQIKDRLGIRTLRVVGDPYLRVTKAALAPGFPGFEPQRDLLARDDVEVLVMGEAHEWETILYGADAVAADMKKALIILGHIPSEQAGMVECAEWLSTFVSEVPVAFIAAAEPFWFP
jgi:putative NIF3 family GTP cyclohydrolase 1 type 2